MAQRHLPLAPGRHPVQVESFGWAVRRSNKNHFVPTHLAKPGILLSIPDHPEMVRGTLRAQICWARLADEGYPEEFDTA